MAEKLPSAWSVDANLSSKLETATCDLQVIYRGSGKSDAEAAAVKANRPVPTSVPIFYYEVRVISKGRDGYIGIGFCADRVLMSRLPGWELHSYGYHGDDGCSFRGCSRGTIYGPTFSTGDVIGACYNQLEHYIMYTKNGVSLGIAFPGVNELLYPTVGLRTPGEKVEANFGTKPFVFDIDSFVQEQKRTVLATIQSTPIPDCDVVRRLVLSYLTHHCYCGTAAALARDLEKGGLQGDRLDSMLRRKQLCSLVEEGRIDEAIRLSQEATPMLFSAFPEVLFSLKCQKFVEMVRAGNDEATMAYGRSELCGGEQPGGATEAVQEVVGLLAYPDPQASPLSYLLEQGRRKAVSEELNVALKALQGEPSRPPLTTLYCQAAAVHKELASTVGRAARLVDLDSDMLGIRGESA
ncbi:RAN binding protein [Klebsormidium nitens]|uniref:RAN binding protein n=1 Tax=Klebsormidium nitens TaxID=105231 RepID=A0A1Y1IRR3_KLENI|nr:RAN binding protein [Klebsormidium nitens]|eukprot:GAQ91941.1 RAN binding protein [Klebsormidium nitens]